MTETPIEISAHADLTTVSRADWDACAGAVEGRPVDPFTTYRFLRALEVSGSVGPGSGWQPRYLTAHQDGQMIAAAPIYAKGHSQGEYIFDHNWAHAYENAGGRYYPKLQIAVPFTPATGRRFLTRPGFEVIGMSALTQGAIQIAAENELSSLHATFCTEAEAIAGEEMITAHVPTDDNPADLGTKVLPGGAKRDKFVSMFLYDLVGSVKALTSIRRQDYIN